MLRNAMGVGGVSFPGKKRYEGVRFNVISVTRGWVGSNSLEKTITPVGKLIAINCKFYFAIKTY